MNRKIGYAGATIILSVVIGGGVFYWYLYYRALENQKKEWYKNHYLQKSFEGKIRDVGDYSYSKDFREEFLNITISTSDSSESEIHYGMLSYIREPLLRTFVSEGDSVFKLAGSDHILFKKMDGRKRRIKLPFSMEEQ